MKIHGTAKGGALSTKDFGVAFGGGAPSCDFVDDFTSYADQAAADAVYPHSESGTVTAKVNVSTDLVGCIYPVSLSLNGLGACTRQTDCNTDDAAWVLRFTNAITNHVQDGGVSTKNFIGMCNASHNTTAGAQQDGIGITSMVQATINKYFSVGVDNGEILTASATDFSSFVPTNGDTDYIEIIRTTSTSFTVEAFENSNYTSSIESTSDSCDDTITGLDFLAFKGNQSREGAALTTDVPKVEFKNAVTVY